MKRIKGITLIEILITVLVLSILVSAAGPSFMDSFKKGKLVSAAEQMYSFLQQARSESIARSEEVHFTVSNMTSSSWSYGMKVGESCDPSKTSNTDPLACVLTIDDGDGSYSAANDDVLFRVDGSEHDELSIRMYYQSGTITTSLVFDPTRGTVDVGRNFMFSDASNNAIVVRVNRLGVVNICSDDYAEYNACGL
ncbi:prepilin-type N-terminal cleavage/methylation domain-containing protein [Thalassotalea sp. HSM 43]|uniref:GspH/FimT family pseudopilin n=1 Tax=Thalassotalea sp. HSM 43 TaxID=2552945 RepID=UPI0010803C86|nr:GspH/FimT family pseudopilin [Thalassotalea sp. HSM 43]QBY03410.1 prepilin-type N-terminal cleavage/methylation domain-containing protein [Thalassotalea sp. HSM 43]